MSVDLHFPVSSQDNNAGGQSFPEPSFGSQTTGDGSDSANSNGDASATISIPIPSTGLGMQGDSSATDTFAPPPLAARYWPTNVNLLPTRPSPSVADVMFGLPNLRGGNLKGGEFTGANCKPAGPAPLPHGDSSYGYPGVRYSQDVQKTCCIIS